MQLDAGEAGPSDGGLNEDAGLRADGGCRVQISRLPFPSEAIDITEDGASILVRYDEVPFSRFALWNDAGLRALPKTNNADYFTAVSEGRVGGATFSPAAHVYEPSQFEVGDGGLRTLTSPSGGFIVGVDGEIAVGVLGNGASIIWGPSRTDVVQNIVLTGVNRRGFASGKRSERAALVGASGVVTELSPIDPSQALSISETLIVGSIGAPVQPAIWRLDAGQTEQLETASYDFGAATGSSKTEFVVGYLGTFEKLTETSCAVWSHRKIVWASEYEGCLRFSAVSDDGTMAAATCQTDAGVVGCRVSIYCEGTQ